MRRLALVIGSALAIVLAAVGVVVWSRVPRSAEDAMRRFYDTSDKAEAELMDPLILAGPKVVPVLSHEVQSKNMPGRRYAVLALGHIGDRRAYETLKTMLDDSNEVPYIRRDALDAIALIDPAAGREEAKRHRNSEIADLAQASRGLLSGQRLRRKTFVSTLIGVD